MILRVPQGDNPQATFKFIEQRAFGISDANWPASVVKRINQITNDYTPLKHRLHVSALNGGFDLFPAIDVSDFTSEITLLSLFRTVVEPRLRHAVRRFTEMEIDVEGLDLPMDEVAGFVAAMEADLE